VTGFLDIPAAPYTEDWRPEEPDRPEAAERFEGLAGFEQAHEPGPPEQSAWSRPVEHPARAGEPEAGPGDLPPQAGHPVPEDVPPWSAPPEPAGIEPWIEAAGTAGAAGPTVTEVAAMAAVAASDGHVPVQGGFEQRIAAVRPVPAASWKRVVFGATRGRLNLG